MAAAAIYLSCRQNNAGRTLDEVCLAAGLTKPTTTSSAGKGNGNDYGTSSSHISEGTGTLAVSSVTVHTGTRSYVSKLQQQLAQWLNLVGPGGHSLPPVRSSHVVARLAAFTLRSPIALNSNKESQDQGYGQGHERESNSLLIERMRWLAGELDSYEADTLSTLPPQQLAAAVVLAISAAQRCLLDINALARATISCTVQGVLDAYVRAVPFINGIMRRVAKRSIKIATMAAKDKSIEKEKEMRVTFDNPLVVAGSGVGSKRGRDLVLATGDHGDGDIKGRGDAASSAYVFIVPVLPPSLADWVDARQVLQLLPLPSSAGKGAVVDIASMLPPSPYSHSLSSSSSAPVSLLPLVPLSSSMKRVGSQEGMASFSTSSTSAYTRSPVSIFLPSRRTVSPSINSNTGLGSGGGTGNSQKSFWNASGSKSGSGGSLSRNSSTGSLGSTESRAGDEDKDKDKESPPISKKS